MTPEETGVDAQVILAGVLGLALAVSEFLSLFPKVKSNGVFQLVGKILTLFSKKGK